MISYTPHQIKKKLLKECGKGYQSLIAKNLGFTRGIVSNVLNGRRTSKRVTGYIKMILELDDDIEIKLLPKWKR